MKHTVQSARLKRLALLVLAGAMLGGCGFMSAGSGAPALAFGCRAERHIMASGVAWEKVQPTVLRVQAEHFDPMTFYFLQGQAYSLEIVNVDNYANNLWAADFLKEGVAVSSIRLGNGAPVYGCVNGVRLPERTTVKINFVAATPGRYEVFNTAVPAIPGQLADAVFHITPAQHGMDSPAN